MARKPQKPQKGQPAIKELYNSVCDIIDYLPSLEVTGDQKSTYVTKSSAGTVIHATQTNSTTAHSNKYYAGDGLRLVSGNVFESALSGGTDIQIVNNVINYTGSGGGGGGGNGHTYTGELNQYNSGFIWVDQSGSDPRLISSTLRWLTQLNNYPLTSDYHFLQTQDLKEGAGTTVNFHYNSIGDIVIDPQTGEEHLVKFIDGIEVDLNVSGGTYITTNFYKGVGYGDYTSASINCNLSGDRQVNHPYGLITIVPQYDGNYNITGGIISTILHAGSGISIDPSTGEITATGGGGGTTVIFKAPDFAKLQVQNDAGETALGLGTTYLVPVASGSAVRYEADGGTIVAVWAPVKGSSENAHAVTDTNWTTTDDGYVRISVIDDGTLSAGCLRLYVDNKDVPLHKFAKFNYSSGAIYEGGRYTTIQETSTRINAETELEEEYTLEKPIINNMLTGGRFVTIQQTENNVALEYPRINCTLQAGTGIDINEQSGIISCTVSSPSTVYDLLAEGPNIKLTKLSNGKTQISGTPEGSGGGGGGGNGPGWPLWENMCGSGHLVYVQQWYTTSTGGWLRISNKGGGSLHGCNSLYIDPAIPPTVDGIQQEGKNHIGLGNAMVSFFLPIPPGSSFWIGMPDDAQCWFDGSTSPATHTSTDHTNMNELKTYVNNAKNNYNSAKNSFDSASSEFADASYDWQNFYPNSLNDRDWYYDKWNYISSYADDVTNNKNEVEYFYNQASTLYADMTTDEGLKYVTSAENYYLSAVELATSAVNFAISAKYYYDNYPT